MVALNPLTPDYGWNEAAGRYIDLATGQFVSGVEIRGALEAVIDGARADIQTISMQLQAGEINLADWQTRMMQAIKEINTAAAAEANGGWAQMSQADWGRAGQWIQKQYEYLDKFADAIFTGDQPLNGNFLRRADLYGQSGRGLVEQMRRAWQKNNNAMEEERRTLGEADHCMGCLEQASRGWQPIGSLDPIGAEECSTNCHCYFEFRRRGPDGWIVVSDE
jgi:hypothetical protein